MLKLGSNDSEGFNDGIVDFDGTLDLEGLDDVEGGMVGEVEILGPSLGVAVGKAMFMDGG
jgi:hypothetical protein